MNFKNISIILAFLSFNLKVLSSPVDKNLDSDIESSNDEIEVFADDLNTIQVVDSDVEEEANSEECLTPDCYEASKRVLTMMDISVDPCEDFYQFSCGGFLRDVEIPKNEVSIDCSYETAKKNTEIIHKILEGEYPINKNLSKKDQELDKKIFNNIKNIYNTCMNEKVINKKGKEPLMKLLKKIDLFKNKSKFEGVDGITNLIILLHQYSVDTFFELYVDADIDNPEENVIYVSQPSLSFSKETFKDKEIVSEFEAAIEETLNLLYDDQQNKINTKEIANSIIKFEQKLSEFTVATQDLQDPSEYNNRSSIDELIEKFPNINWKLYFETMFKTYGIKTPVNNDIFVSNDTPKYFRKFNKFIKETDIDTLLNYAEWTIIATYLDYISEEYNKPLDDLEKILSGVEEEQPKYKDCMNIVEKLMGDAVGKYFIEESFDSNSKKGAEEVINNVKQAMINRIPKMEWLDKETADYAIEKVNSMTSRIGYPDYILDVQQLAKEYDGFEVDSEDFFTNILNYKLYTLRKSIEKIDQPADKKKWIMTPQTIDAFYYSLDNSINFPAGILQQPYFNANEPDYLNYGGIGSVVGHELTHAFDSAGSQFDATGRYNNWWSDASFEEFDNLSMCFVEQYDQYSIKDKYGEDHYVNGMLTINENLADNGGTSRAYEAWRLSNKDTKKFNERNKPLPGLSNYTNDQLFYIAFGQSWCDKMRPEYLVDLLEDDFHAPSQHRVNGVVSNSEHFAKVFNCPKNSPMNPEKKCLIW